MRFFAPVIAIGLVCSLALPTTAQEPTSPAAVQPERGNEVLGTVVHGNTTIIFESAGTHGIDSKTLSTWDQFAEEHPKIATALAYKPSLINDSGYLGKHPNSLRFSKRILISKMRWKRTPGILRRFHRGLANKVIGVRCLARSRICVPRTAKASVGVVGGLTGRVLRAFLDLAQRTIPAVPN